MSDKNPLLRSLKTLGGVLDRSFRPARLSAKQSFLPRQFGFLGLMAILVCAVIWLFFTQDGALTRWKRQALEGDSLLISIFEWITLSGTSGWILIITGVIGLALSLSDWAGLPRSERLRRTNLFQDVNFIFFTVALSGISANLIKNTIGRARPRLFDEVGPHFFNPAAFESKFASFPSGHSTTSGALFMGMILLFPRWWPIWLAAGLLGGLSRFIVGAHYPSDIVAGLAFGALFVIFSARWLALRGTMFTFNASWIPERRRHRA